MYDDLWKFWNKVIDTNTYKVLTTIPFNWHGVFHLKPQNEYDPQPIHSALYRFFRGNPAFAFEDTSEKHKGHIHWLLCLNETNERQFHEHLKENYDEMVRKHTIFQRVPLFSKKNRHIQPIRKDVKSALDYISRANLMINRPTFVSKSIQNQRAQPLILDRANIPFHKENPYLDVCGYSNAAKSEPVNDLPLTYWDHR